MNHNIFNIGDTVRKRQKKPCLLIDINKFGVIGYQIKSIEYVKAVLTNSKIVKLSDVQKAIKTEDNIDDDDSTEVVMRKQKCKTR